MYDGEWANEPPEWYPGSDDDDEVLRMAPPEEYRSVLLTGDEIHVVLDCLPSRDEDLRGRDPWNGYDPNPDDPKTFEPGWRELLGSALEKLNAELSRL